jgi:hypothetical protein
MSQNSIRLSAKEENVTQMNTVIMLDENRAVVTNVTGAWGCC